MDEQEIKRHYWDQVPSGKRLLDVLQLVLGLEDNRRIASLKPQIDLPNSYLRDRIFSSARLTREMFLAADPLQVSEAGLRSLADNWQGVHAELVAFEGNGNAGHLQNARNQIDGAVYPTMWAFFPSNQSPSIGTAFIEAIRKVATESELQISKLKEQTGVALEELGERAGDLTEDLANTHEQLSSLEGRISQRNQENDATTAKLESTFASGERARQERVQAFIDLQKIGFDTRAADKENAADALLKRLEAQEERVLRLVEAIGTRGITANYSVIAEEELGAANRWRIWTLSVFALGLAAACYIFYKFLDVPLDHMNLGEVALRFGFALAITSPALYTARESARHRTTGDRARQAEMELASLGPFIANLERDSQDSIRRDLVAKYFGRQQEVHSGEPPVKFKDVGELAVELVKATREGAEKKK